MNELMAFVFFKGNDAFVLAFFVNLANRKRRRMRGRCQGRRLRWGGERKCGSPLDFIHSTSRPPTHKPTAARREMNERERFFFFSKNFILFVVLLFFHFCQVSAAVNGMNEHGRLNCFPIENCCRVHQSELQDLHVKGHRHRQQKPSRCAPKCGALTDRKRYSFKNRWTPVRITRHPSSATLRHL